MLWKTKQRGAMKITCDRWWLVGEGTGRRHAGDVGAPRWHCTGRWRWLRTRVAEPVCFTAAGGSQRARRGRVERRARVRRWREAGSWARSRGGPRVGPPPEGGTDLGEVARRAVCRTAAGGRQGAGHGREEGRARDHRRREARELGEVSLERRL